MAIFGASVQIWLVWESLYTNCQASCLRVNSITYCDFSFSFEKLKLQFSKEACISQTHTKVVSRKFEKKTVWEVRKSLLKKNYIFLISSLCEINQSTEIKERNRNKGCSFMAWESYYYLRSGTEKKNSDQVRNNYIIIFSCLSYL